jgi:ATPase subunit of ABC transporter with duplicated ATPase domains
MLEIVFNNVKRNFGYRDVLNGLSFEIITGDRMAIIGANGCGKTTALNILAGKEKIDSGLVTIRSGATIGYLQQSKEELDLDTTVIDLIKTGQEELMDIEYKMQELTKSMSKANCDLDKLLGQYDRVQNVYIAKGGYELEESFNKICSGCKISPELLNKNYNILSGGEKTLVNIARILYSNPDILLLDEPTNHLDIQTTQWLEDFIKKYSGTVIIVSHDRYFMDKVATKTLLIEEGKGNLYHGNYSYFLEEDERRTLAQFDHYKNQQKQIAAMKASIKQLRDFGNRSGNEKLFKRAASIQKRLDKMDITQKPITEKSLSLNFDLKERSGKDVIVIEDLKIAFGSNKLIQDGQMNVHYSDKVCLMGKNGTGKSTLLKVILGELKITPPRDKVDEVTIRYSKDNEATVPHSNSKSSEATITASRFKVGDSVKIGYISQEIHFDSEDDTILKLFQKHCMGSETLQRTKLSRFRFVGDDVFKKVASLSGGERVKLKLACLMEENVNCIILDEPTNHIDIDTREVLEESLNDYKGTLLFVTHDRYFTNKLAQKIMVIEDFKINEYSGNYDDYLQERKPN